MQALRDYLASIPAGRISETDELENLLAACWDQLDGSHANKMEGYKLYDRMERVVWRPPILRFMMERHGGTSLGSTRAECYEWEIDVQESTARWERIGYRQVSPRQPRLNVRPMVEDMAQLILDGREDKRLKWNKDGSVRVRIGEVLPAGSAVKETLAGRRKRFRKAMDELLGNAGWQKVRPNVYAPPPFPMKSMELMNTWYSSKYVRWFRHSEVQEGRLRIWVDNGFSRALYSPYVPMCLSYIGFHSYMQDLHDPM